MRRLLARFFDSKSETERRVKLIVVAIILIVIAVFVVRGLSHLVKNGGVLSGETDADIEAGLEYLQSQAEGDVDSYQSEINAIDKEKRQTQLEADPESVWSAFNDAVIIGDSRAYGFYSYELLPEKRVLAKSGGKITDITEDTTYLEQIKDLDPHYVFICMGINDIGIGFYPEGTDLANAYADQIAKVQEVVPEAQIIVSSIPRCLDEAVEQNEAFGRTDEYNEALKTMCEEKGYTFVDVSDTVTDEIFQEDGIHFVKDYYIKWATQLVLGMD